MCMWSSGSVPPLTIYIVSAVRSLKINLTMAMCFHLGKMLLNCVSDSNSWIVAVYYTETVMRKREEKKSYYGD